MPEVILKLGQILQRLCNSCGLMAAVSGPFTASAFVCLSLPVIWSRARPITVGYIYSICSRPVLGSTGGVGTFKIVKTLQKDKKGITTLQITFSLTGSAEDTTDGAKAGAAPPADAVAALDHYETSAAVAKIECVLIAGSVYLCECHEENVRFNLFPQ